LGETLGSEIWVGDEVWCILGDFNEVSSRGERMGVNVDATPEASVGNESF